MAHTRLAEGGSLALAIENRLGLKYFNGCSEDHTGRPFDSINDLYPPRACRTFGRRELTQRLQRAGFTRIDGLYPFPDYKLPRCIVGDRALAAQDLDVGQIIGQYPARDYTGKGLRMFNEGLAWRSVANNGLVPDMANSFLLIAGASGAAPIEEDWLLSLFATDRRACFRTHTRFARTPHGGIEVVKQRLHPRREPAPGPLSYCDRGAQAYSPGERLSDGLAALTFHADAYARYIAYARRYLEALRDLAGAAADKSIAGDFIDCIPPNLVNDGAGGFQFIDAEWAAGESVAVGYMAFRAVIHDLARAGAFGTLFLFDGCADMGEFVRRVLGDLGMDAAPQLVEEYVRREAAILAQVNMPRPDAERHFAQLLRDQLSMPPAQLLSTVMDPDALQAVLRTHHFGRYPLSPAPA